MKNLVPRDYSKCVHTHTHTGTCTHEYSDLILIKDLGPDNKLSMHHTELKMFINDTADPSSLITKKLVFVFRSVSSGTYRERVLDLRDVWGLHVAAVQEPGTSVYYTNTCHIVPKVHHVPGQWILPQPLIPNTVNYKTVEATQH